MEIHENPLSVFVRQLGQNVFPVLSVRGTAHIGKTSIGFEGDFSYHKVLAGVLAVEEWIAVETYDFFRILRLRFLVLSKCAHQFRAEGGASLLDGKFKGSFWDIPVIEFLYELVTGLNVLGRGLFRS